MGYLGKFLQRKGQDGPAEEIPELPSISRARSSVKSSAHLSNSGRDKRLMSRIKVLVRVRPKSDAEEAKNLPVSVNISGPESIRVPIDRKKFTDMQFNAVFGPENGQEEFFARSGIEQLLQLALEGYSVTIFAYGQTGSGKTYTITGPSSTPQPENVGLVPRSLQYMFDRASQPESKLSLQASYLEIYNEHVIKQWTKQRGFFVENLYIINCGVLDDALSVLEEGLRNRTTASHNLNDHSSRSHSVLTVYCESESFPEGAEVPVKKFGKVSFIDLAGSERVKLSKATGETFNEMLKINQSLLNLSKCISTLSDHRKHTHVPFRDSKLTMLLQDSLMGNGQALMIACVSPLLANMHETIKTLRYAQQASHIPSRPVLNVDPRIEAFLRMKQEINDLRKENLELRTLLEKEDVDEPNGSIADDLVNNQNSVSLPTLLYQSDQIEDSPVELRRLAYSQDNILGSLEAQERLLDMHRRRSETKREQQREQAGSRTSVKSNSSRIRRSPSIPFEDRPQWIDASSRKNPLPNRRIKSQDISPAKQRIESLHKSAVAAKDAYMLDANRISTPYPYSSLSKKQEANTVPKAKTNHGNIKYTITKNRIYPKKNVIPPIQRLTTGVTRAVKNRHNDMQDVHALDAEIKRMSFI